MKLIKSLLFEDISTFEYFLPEKSIKEYQRNKLLCAFSAFFLASVYIILKGMFEFWLCIPLAMVFAYKLPYMYYKLVHKQNIVNVIIAIPLWVNQIYALIENNTIHNAIVYSFDEDTPKAIAKDLKDFIAQIEKTPDSKVAYLNFLKRYNVDGFTDIMLKLYEFRSLSKEKLKYEIKNLNIFLGKIEEEKRKNQFRSELQVIDFLICMVIFVACIYMSAIAMMPSLFMV